MFNRGFASVLLVVAVLLGAIGVVGARANSPASASSHRTYVYAFGMSGRWDGPKIRPREIAFGALYAVANLRWSHWHRNVAYGRGHYYGFGSYRAYVALYGVKVHNHRRYFSWIKIAEPGHKTRHLHYSRGLWHTR